MSITVLAPAARTAAGPFVLRARQLRPGIRLSQTSRYGDEIWRFKQAMLKEHERAYILNFPVLPDRFRPAAKRVFSSLLTAEPPDGEDQISLHSIRSYFNDLKALMLWLDKRWPPDRVTLGEVTPGEGLQVRQVFGDRVRCAPGRSDPRIEHLIHHHPRRHAMRAYEHPASGPSPCRPAIGTVTAAARTRRGLGARQASGLTSLAAMDQKHLLTAACSGRAGSCRTRRLAGRT